MVFFVATERALDTVERDRRVLVWVTIGADPEGVIVEVIVTVAGVLVTEKGNICRAVKSIHDVLEKKLAIWKAVASRSVIW